MDNRLNRIKVIFLDVDGVLTNGMMIYLDNGKEFFEGKLFSVRDGMGINLARLGGIKVGIITSEEKVLLKKRAEKLKLDFVFLGVKDKLSKVEKFCKENGFNKEEILFVGDDINDLSIMNAIGVPCTVNNAIEEVKNLVKERDGIISSKNGGEGAVRDIIEYFFKQRGEWEKLITKFIEFELNFNPHS
jgi:YrbI family 3-deoxy-D-manno-octulosonate 8-phosphate phosphatase